jgi:hypothetical protein
MASRARPDVAKRPCSAPRASAPAIDDKTLRCRARRPQGGRLHSSARMVRNDRHPVVVWNHQRGPWVCRGFPSGSIRHGAPPARCAKACRLSHDEAFLGTIFIASYRDAIRAPDSNKRLAPYPPIAPAAVRGCVPDLPDVSITPDGTSFLSAILSAPDGALVGEGRLSD